MSFYASSIPHLCVAGFLDSQISWRQVAGDGDAEFLRWQPALFAERQPRKPHYKNPQATRELTCCIKTLFTQCGCRFPHNLTWRLQGFFPLGVCLGIDVTSDVVEGEEKVVLVVELCRKLDLHLQTQGREKDPASSACIAWAGLSNPILTSS